MKRHCEFDAQLENLEEVKEFLATQLDNVCSESDLVFDIKVAAEEVFTNIVKYGLARRQTDKIKLQLWFDGESVQLEISDNGRAFNPLKSSNPGLNSPIEDRDIGGLGIYLVKELMDEVYYRRSQKKNTLTLIKNLPVNKNNKEQDMPLSVNRSVKSPGIITLSVGGSLDAITSSQLEMAVKDILNGSAKGLIFNFELLEFISSAGIRVVLLAQKELKKKGGAVMFLNMQPQIQKVFDIIKALPDQTVFSSDEELDDYLSEMQERFRE